MTTVAKILALEDKRRAAMVAGDVAGLETMSHDELLYTHGSGNVDTKASWLEAMRSGRTRYRSAQCDDPHVRILGDAALLTGKATFEVEINGQLTTLRMRFLNMWAKTPDGWKFAAWQATPLRE